MKNDTRSHTVGATLWLDLALSLHLQYEYRYQIQYEYEYDFVSILEIGQVFLYLFTVCNVKMLILPLNLMIRGLD